MIEVEEVAQLLKPFEFSLAPSYDLARGMLDAGTLHATTVFTPTVEIAIGLIRPLHDYGMHAWREISVCSFGQPEKARTTNQVTLNSAINAEIATHVNNVCPENCLRRQFFVTFIFCR